MKIVIIGDGKVGHTLSEQLSIEGHDVVIIDKNIEPLKESRNTLDIMCVEGNGINYEVQMEADVPNADLVIATTSTDEMNMLCCLLAKKHGAKQTIARVRNLEYFSQLNYIKDDLGLSMTVNPELAAASEISRTLIFPSALQVEPFAKGRVELVEINIEENSPLIGLKLNQIYKKYQIQVLVGVVQREDNVYIPSGDFVLQKGDKIHITATHKNIESFFRAIGIYKDKVRTVIIVGGSRIAYYLAKHLLSIGMEVKVIEKDKEKCMLLADLLPDATIIFGNATNHELLLEEGIEDVDAFVALTGVDEENIVLSMFAKSKNVSKNIIKINNISFAELVDDMNLGTIVAPKVVICNQIVRYVRALENSKESNVKALHLMVNNRVEALEFDVKGNLPFIGQTLRELNLKDNILVSSIIRNRKVIIPNGNDTIQDGDSVIVITVGQHLQDIREIIR